MPSGAEITEPQLAAIVTVPMGTKVHRGIDLTRASGRWGYGMMLGFDAEERLIQKLPHNFAAKVVWGSRYPHHDTTSAWDAIALLTQANVEASLMARMLGGNAAQQFGIELVQTVGA